MLETAGATKQVHLSSGLLKIERAWLADAVEHNRREIQVRDGAIEIGMEPHAIVTVRLLLRR